jgi:hypothetical protein
MFIAILQDGEVENEVDVDLCCAVCSKWSVGQFNFVTGLIAQEKPIPVPAEVDNAKAFREYIKTMNL